MIITLFPHGTKKNETKTEKQKVVGHRSYKRTMVKVDNIINALKGFRRSLCIRIIFIKLMPMAKRYQKNSGIRRTIYNGNNFVLELLLAEGRTCSKNTESRIFVSEKLLKYQLTIETKFNRGS